MAKKKDRKIAQRNNRITKAPVPSLNALKKRVRDIERQLQRSEKLPADVKLTQERELDSLKNDIEDATKSHKDQRTIKKYHMVRFFERKKAIKRVKQAKSRMSLAKTPEEMEEEKREVQNCEIDLNYTLYSPLTYKYASLYAASRTDGERSEPFRDYPMWEVVKRATAMGQGQLEALRDGVGNLENSLQESVKSISHRDAEHGHSGERYKEGKLPTKKKSAKKKQAEEEQADDDEGFFEE